MESVTAGWDNFFVVEAGAAAALSGLLFVSISINLTRILQFEHLPGRAAETLAILLSVLFTSTLGLVPRQSEHLLAAELAASWTLFTVLVTVIEIRSLRYKNVWNRMPLRATMTHVALLPILIAAVTLWIGAGGGIAWLVAAALLSFASGVFNAWVLLIEIQR